MKEIKETIEQIITDRVADAICRKKRVRVVRWLLDEKQVCVGYVREIAIRKSPETDKDEICFTVQSDGTWWMTGTLQHLSLWISQVSEFEFVDD